MGNASIAPPEPAGARRCRHPAWLPPWDDGPFAAPGSAPRRTAPATSHRFNELRRRYERFGGLLSCDMLACMLREHRSQPISAVAHWIAGRRMPVVSAEGTLWVAAAHVEWHAATLVRGLSQVMATLGGVFDDEEILDWFVEPNSWLQADRCPLDCLRSCPERVAEVARADRVIAVGWA